MVIQQLPDELKDAICVFYLALRALDTIEDDMTIPPKEKVPRLQRFHLDMADRCTSPAGLHAAVAAPHLRWCLPGSGPTAAAPTGTSSSLSSTPTCQQSATS